MCDNIEYFSTNDISNNYCTLKKNDYKDRLFNVNYQPKIADNKVIRLNGDAGMLRKKSDDDCRTDLRKTNDNILRQTICLDNYPYESQSNITPNINCNGMYKSYSDINTGNIVYYTDKNISQPYTLPNYINPANVDNNIVRDCMNNTRTYYNRQPVTRNNRGLSDYQFMIDSIEHREDITSLLMQEINNRDYGMAWDSVIN
jgi:hypothetical protein